MPGTNLKKFSYRQLDHAINKRAVSFKRNLRVLIPYLRAMRKLLRDPGKRNALPNAETLPTWTEWKESKRRTLGLAPRTIALLLETGTLTMNAWHFARKESIKPCWKLSRDPL